VTTAALDRELAHLYARALVAIARGDGEISTEEAGRLQRQIDERCTWPIAIDDLLLDAPLSPHHLAELAFGGDTPFRSPAFDPALLAALIVTDGLAVVLAKGHVTAGETASLRAFAAALRLPDAEFARLTAHGLPKDSG
jgi:hypothetical protein